MKKQLFLILCISIYSPMCSMEHTNERGEELINAARQGMLHKVQSLICVGTPVNYQNTDGFTALIFSANQGHEKIVQCLLKVGADPYIRTYRDNCSAIVYAAANTACSKNCCSLLVESMLWKLSEKQKKWAYTFLLSIKRVYKERCSNLHNIFKERLRTIIQEENAPRALAEVNQIAYVGERMNLIQKYFSKP